MKPSEPRPATSNHLTAVTIVLILMLTIHFAIVSEKLNDIKIQLGRIEQKAGVRP